MQVLFLLCAIEIRIVNSVQILFTLVVHHVVMDLAMGEILVDIETTHPLMDEGGRATGLLVGAMIALVMLLVHSKGKMWLEVIQMYGQEKVTGYAICATT